MDGRLRPPFQEQEMAHQLELDSDRLGDDPLILIIPGLNNSNVSGASLPCWASA